MASAGSKVNPVVRRLFWGSTGLQGFGLHVLGTGFFGVNGGKAMISLAIIGYSFKVIETSAAAILRPFGVILVAVIDMSAITH